MSVKEKEIVPPAAGPLGFGLRVQLVDCTATLLSEIKLRESTRKDIALTYALALVSEDGTKWMEVNQAIIERWSLSGLKYIKQQAWKLVDHGKVKRAPQAAGPAKREQSPESP